MDIVLTRFAYTPERTLGQIVVGSLTLATIERSWIPNPAGPGGMPRESCVPWLWQRTSAQAGGHGGNSRCFPCPSPPPRRARWVL